MLGDAYNACMQKFEVEIKALLGGPERADEIRRAMKLADRSYALHSKNKQLNHYFEPSPSAARSLEELRQVVGPHLTLGARVRLSDLTKKAKTFSARTRDKDGEVLLVVKASVDDTTSANGISRMEFEEKVPMTLEELDQLVLSAGFACQAKWSREREEYVCKGVNVTLDKNAGYGWLAEFERIVDDAEKLQKARDEIRALMRELSVEELSQARLERMFAYYNAHWPEYYGTDKIFVVE